MLKSIYTPAPRPAGAAKLQVLTNQYRNLYRRVGPRAKPVKVSSPGPRVTTTEVDAAIRRLRPGTCPGTDGIENELIKAAPAPVRAVITQMVRTSVRDGEVPTDWKTVECVALPKPNKPDDYRPVSLTQTLCKLTEHVVAARIRHFVPNIPDQYAFTPGCGTADVIANILHEAVETQLKRSKDRHFNQKAHRVLSTMLDCTKAFDCMNHRTLLDIMRRRGIPAHLIRWVRNWLSGRSMRVRDPDARAQGRKGKMGSTIHVNRGAPQGSVLGPLLWILYISELPEIIKNGDIDILVYLYADDITFTVGGSDEAEIQKKAQAAVDRFSEWAVRHDLKASHGKCETMWITRGRPKAVDIKLDGNVIAFKKDAVKLLGVRIDRTTTFKKHTEAAYTECRGRLKQLGAIGKRYSGPTPRQMHLFALQYVWSVILYGSEVWGPFCCDDTFKDIEKVANSAARIVSGTVSSTRTGDAISEGGFQLDAKRMAMLRSFSYVERTREKQRWDQRPRTVPPLEQDVQNHFRAWHQEVNALAGLTDVPRAPQVDLRWAPWETGWMSRVHIDASPPGQLSAGDDADLKHAANQKRIDGSVPHLRWLATSDGTAGEKEGHPLGCGGGYLFRERGVEIASGVEASWKGGCSYTAELMGMKALLGKLQQLLEELQQQGVTRRVNTLIVTDSQSVLARLKCGPLNKVHCPVEREIWNRLGDIAQHPNVRNIHLKFIFAHCGHELNDRIDVVADGARRLPEGPALYRDLKAAAKKALKEKMVGLRQQDSHRAGLGLTAQSKPRQMDIPKEMYAKMAQTRCGETPKFGRLSHRMGTFPTESCRFCTSDDAADSSWYAMQVIRFKDKMAREALSRLEDMKFDLATQLREGLSAEGKIVVDHIMYGTEEQILPPGGLNARRYMCVEDYVPPRQRGGGGDNDDGDGGGGGGDGNDDEVLQALGLAPQRRQRICGKPCTNMGGLTQHRVKIHGLQNSKELYDERNFGALAPVDDVPRETISHLMTECPFLKPKWRMMRAVLGIPEEAEVDYYGDELKERIGVLEHHCHEVEQRLLQAAEGRQEEVEADKERCRGELERLWSPT